MAAKQIYDKVKIAQERDEQEQEKEAYQYYLSAVEQIVSQLQIASPSSTPVKNIGQLFKIASNCLESAQTIFNTAANEHREFKCSYNPSVSPRHSPSVQMTMSVPDLYAKDVHKQRQLSESPSQTSLSPTNPHHHSISAPSDPSSPGLKKRLMEKQMQSKRQQQWQQRKKQFNVQIQPLHCISPMDEARKKNMYLMKQYQAQMRKNSTRMLGESRQNVSLNYLRRLEENRSVARITEQTIARKAKEREARIREENQKLRQSRLKSMDSLSMEEIQQEVISFEHGKMNLHTLKQKLVTDPTSTSHVVSIVNEVLSMSDHPLCKLFGECQFSVTQFLQPFVRTIEQSGELPHLKISRDNSGSSHLTTPPHNSTAYPTKPFSQNNSSGDSNSSEKNETAITSKDPSSTTDLLDSKLAALRSELVNREQKSSTGDFDNIESVFVDEVDELKVISSSRIVSPPPESMPFTTMSTEFLNDEEFSEDDFQTMKEAQFEDDFETDGNKTTSQQTETINNDDNTTDICTASTEEVDEVVFRGLHPVICTPYYGDQATLERLSQQSSIYIDGAVKLIHSAIDKLLHTFKMVYRQLNTENNTDVCRTVLEATFFPPITPLLLPLYRCSNYKTECAIAKNMSQQCNATPKDISIRKKFWLHDQDSVPYSQAINLLSDLCSLHCPTPKLESLVSLSKCIIQCIEEYYCVKDSVNKESVDTAVGVDDILPIMTFVIIQSGLPQLVSECSFMQEFIQEDYSMGEEGFCLTSFDTAVKYVSQMTS